MTGHVELIGGNWVGSGLFGEEARFVSVDCVDFVWVVVGSVGLVVVVGGWDGKSLDELGLSAGVVLIVPEV